MKSFGKTAIHFIFLFVLVFLVKAGVPPILFIAAGIIWALVAWLISKSK